MEKKWILQDYLYLQKFGYRYSEDGMDPESDLILNF